MESTRQFRIRGICLAMAMLAALILCAPTSSTAAAPTFNAAEKARIRKLNETILQSASVMVPAEPAPVPAQPAPPAPADSVPEGTGNAIPAPAEEANTGAAAPEPAPEPESGPAQHFAIAPRGQVLLAALEDPADEALSREVLSAKLDVPIASRDLVTFPGALRVQAENGSELQLKPFILIGQRLRFDHDHGLFVGSIKLGVVAITDVTESQKLTAPVNFEVLDTRLADPALMNVTMTSPPYAEIKISTPTVSQSVTIRVASRFHPQGEEITLPVIPALQVLTDRGSIQGYGLETTRVHVTFVGEGEGRGRVVELKADPSGFFDNSRVILDEHGTGTTVLRSDGAGTVTIAATSAGLASGWTTVTFSPPTRSLAAGGIGALGGAMIRLVPGIRRGGRVGYFLGRLVVAMLCGLLAFVLYAVGVNVLAISPTVTVGSIVVIAMTAVGAFTGAGFFQEPGTTNRKI